jgi:hypothetical protein
MESAVVAIDDTLFGWQGKKVWATTSMFRGVSHRGVSHRDASHRDASHRDVSHRDASHRDASHRDASHRDAEHAHERLGVNLAAAERVPQSPEACPMFYRD